jgi:hypothetical protein
MNPLELQVLIALSGMPDDRVGPSLVDLVLRLEESLTVTRSGAAAGYELTRDRGDGIATPVGRDPERSVSIPAPLFVRP